MDAKKSLEKAMAQEMIEIVTLWNKKISPSLNSLFEDFNFYGILPKAEEMEKLKGLILLFETKSNDLRKTMREVSELGDMVYPKEKLNEYDFYLDRLEKKKDSFFNLFDSMAKKIYEKAIQKGINVKRENLEKVGWRYFRPVYCRDEKFLIFKNEIDEKNIIVWDEDNEKIIFQY